MIDLGVPALSEPATASGPGAARLVSETRGPGSGPGFAEALTAAQARLGAGDAPAPAGALGAVALGEPSTGGPLSPADGSERPADEGSRSSGLENLLPASTESQSTDGAPLTDPTAIASLAGEAGGDRDEASTPVAAQASPDVVTVAPPMWMAGLAPVPSLRPQDMGAAPLPGIEAASPLQPGAAGASAIAAAAARQALGTRGPQSPPAADASVAMTAHHEGPGAVEATAPGSAVIIAGVAPDRGAGRPDAGDAARFTASESALITTQTAGSLSASFDLDQRPVADDTPTGSAGTTSRGEGQAGLSAGAGFSAPPAPATTANLPPVSGDAVLRRAEGGATATTAQNPHHVGAQLTFAATDAKPGFDLRLEAPGLGAVEVEIREADGQADVLVRSDRAETLAVLARDGWELDRALRDAGIGHDGRTLSFLLSADRGPRDQHSPGHAPGGTRAPSPEHIAERSASGPKGLLDIHV